PPEISADASNAVRRWPIVAAASILPRMRQRLPSRIASFSPNKLKLGLFGSNCSGGRAATRVPERWSASWEDNLKLAQLADAAGMDLMLPIGRWRGYGGETNFEGSSWETVT